LIIKIRAEVDTSAIEGSRDGNVIARKERRVAEEPGIKL
jgi:hypothetical protein